MRATGTTVATIERLVALDALPDDWRSYFEKALRETGPRMQEPRTWASEGAATHRPVKPASFYASPQEAMQAPPEEFLYVACLHEGTGVDAPDFLAVVDAEEGRIVHETPMPNVGDELHHFGWNRCSSACHGPDRSHLIVPGFRSSRIHVVNVADDPRRPRIEKVIEPDEVVAKTGYTRPHTVHCMPGDNVVISMLGDADGNGAGGFAVLDAKTFELKGRWENGGETPPLNYDFWYQPRKNVLVSSEFGEPNAYEKGFDLDDVAAGRYGQPAPLLEPRRAHARADDRPRRERADPARGALAPRPRGRAGLRRRGALEHDVALAPRERRLEGRAGDRGRGRRARGLAVPGARADHRPRPLDGRPLPLLLELAARRPAPVRRLRSRATRS